MDSGKQARHMFSPIICVPVGGALFIRYNRRASGAHYISHRMLYDMNGVRLALFVSASSCECLPIENITHDSRFYYYY